MTSPEDFEHLAALLRSPANATNISAALHTDLMLGGAILMLQQDGSASAMQILASTVLDGFNDPTRTAALNALDQLAMEGKTEAISLLYSLYIKNACNSARDIIIRRGFQAVSTSDEILFALLSGDSQRLFTTDPSLEQLTHIFQTVESPQVQDRMLQSASRIGLSHWGITVQAIHTLSPQSLAALVERFGSFLPPERALAVLSLANCAAKGEAAAQETLCSIYLQFEEQLAGKIALENGYLPREPIDHALFLFLTGQWQQYETFDFNHRLLIAAYENSDTRMRKRLLDLARRSGQMEWFQSLSTGNRARWLTDLTDVDWESAINRLQSAERYQDLWRLAQYIAPTWSARILLFLKGKSWQPDGADERVAFANLINLADKAQSTPLVIRANHAVSLPGMEQYTCMALSSDGNFLALGTATNAIRIWRITDNPVEQAVLYGAVSQTRSLAFSPDSDYLVAGVGDHSLRVYRWQESKTAKSLEGHSGLVRSILVSPDNRALYSASFDGSIREWRFPYGPAQKTIHQSSGEIFGIALGAAAETLAAAGADTDIQVFRLPGGQLLHTLSGHQATITTLAAAPQSDLVASYSRDRSIRVWNTLSARQLSIIPNLPDVITSMCIHPNEDILAAAGLSGKITVYALSTGVPIDEITAHRKAIIGLAFTPNGKHLVSASVDGAVTIWGLETHLLARQPIESYPLHRVAELEKRIHSPETPQAEKNWFAFILGLLHWRQRFDIQIESPQIISIGDFDIQLG